MRSVPLICCLPKMSRLLPSSSTSTGWQIATWRRSLPCTCPEFSFDLQSLLTGKMFVWLPAFLSERAIFFRTIKFYQSQLSDLTIRLHITTSLKSITETVTLSPIVQNGFSSTFSVSITWPIILRPHWSNRLQLIHRYDQLLISSEINYVRSTTVTVLQRNASTQQIGLLLVPAIKGAVYINTHCNYSQPVLTKLYNVNIGGQSLHLYTCLLFACRRSRCWHPSTAVVHTRKTMHALLMKRWSEEDETKIAIFQHFIRKTVRPGWLVLGTFHGDR